MFQNLTDLALQRNWKQAIGFYIVYALIGIVLGGISGGIVGILHPSNVQPDLSHIDFGSLSAKAGAVTAVIYSLCLSGAVCYKKNLGVLFYLLGLVGPVLALFGGTILGVIPIAYLSTRAVNASKVV